MRIKKFAAAALLGVAALGLSACASSLNTVVSRYQAMPAPQGQTFFVVPGDGMAANGGLEFQRYAGLVAQQLQARGYTPASSPQSANMLVQFGYGVDNGQVRVVEDPFYRSRFYDPFFGPSFYYPRYGFRSAFYYGWNDPFWYRGGVDSYVEYHSQIDLHIRRAGSNQPLFDGRAQARSESNRLDVLLPGLVEAMFTGFPGQSGETVKITIPSRPRA
ncbi:MAG TPA: DUF4136 domain-containing protein [Sphingomicrobium sp.]|jgi:hypothetical protein|nr:DUF4136 domain-containing protein [Sphingomicrobium sp.]